MASKDAKQIVYRYNGIEADDEFEFDRDGEIDLPQVGEFILHKGNRWKAVHRIIESSGAGAVPIVRLFLTDKF